ncbi:MAG: RNA pseudouridine synthase [Lachnospiraceae bacterium]|nr:RNA pseudouridine synthase [Lachnospiraceae bacterium]
MDIIYEDREIIVCHKMPGIPVQTGKIGQMDLISILRNYLAEKGETPEIFLVHRLDQPVEGIMVFAKTKSSAADLGRQIQEKRVEKKYLALTEGIFTEKTGTLENYLLRDGKSNTSKVVPKGTKGAKLARLSYEVQRELEGNASLVKVSLETGRHHQIRVQMAQAGHPLIGDKKYNKNCPKKYIPVGLCSVGTSFCHPSTGQKMEFETEPKGELFAKIKNIAMEKSDRKTEKPGK